MYYVEKLKCFIVASVDIPTKYLHVIGGKKYSLANKLAGATKIASRETAYNMIKYYYSSTGDDRDFVVIPMEVSYELIDEREITR